MYVYNIYIYTHIYIYIYIYVCVCACDLFCLILDCRFIPALDGSKRREKTEKEDEKTAETEEENSAANGKETANGKAKGHNKKTIVRQEATDEGRERGGKWERKGR